MRASGRGPEQGGEGSRCFSVSVFPLGPGLGSQASTASLARPACPRIHVGLRVWFLRASPATPPALPGGLKSRVQFSANTLRLLRDSQVRGLY